MKARKLKPHLVIRLLVVTSLVFTANAQDWTQWRGPHRDGVVTNFAPPALWPEKLKLVWKTPVGSGYSSPLVSQGKVWLHSSTANEEVVACYDLKTGKPVWRKAEPVNFKKNQYATKMSGGPFSTPALHQGKVYTLSVNAVLSCFDAATGALKWRKDFGLPDTSKMFCGTAMSPVIEGGNVIVYVGDDIKGGQMLAFDAATGQEKWKWTGEGPGYASPIVTEIAGVRQLVTMSDKSVISVATRNGQLLWRMPWPDEWNENIVTPLRYQDMLIFSGVRKGTLALRVNRTGQEWKTQEVWRNSELTLYMNSPVLAGDHLYGLTNKRKGMFFCLEAATGKLRWQTEGREGDTAALLNAKDTLFLLTSDASLIVANKNPQGFQQLAKYTVAESPTYAHPVLLGNQMLVKDETNLTLWSWAQD
jgi:outer membrane protein assembly factor BamB